MLSPEDARKAVDIGVDGIVVSNHGGRQLDYSPAALDMIAPVRAAIGHRVPLLMDGGIRRGTDVLKVQNYIAAGLVPFTFDELASAVTFRLLN